MATVVVGISGGVDSSVAALLLKEQGHDVIGVHMTNWDTAEEGMERCGEEDARDARRVCEHLGIGFERVSFVKEYWHDVFEPLLQGYHEGGTPNPDVWCNRHIKFDRFVSKALALGADHVATGHYARVDREGPEGTSRLLVSADPVKDQSYFMCAIRQSALRHALFPLGDLQKPEVRERAAAAGLHVAGKRDSVGICFIGKRRFGDFLSEYLPQKAGKFVDIESGQVVGQHRGYALYTPGQRARVPGLHSRWYVVDKDPSSNVVHICEGRDHPGLFTRELVTTPPHWIAGSPPAALQPGVRLPLLVKARTPGEIVPCTVEIRPATASGAAAGTLSVRFDEPTRDIAEMQTIALYARAGQLGGSLGGCDGSDADAASRLVCLGGAMIRERGISLWEETLAMGRMGFSSGRDEDGVTYVSG